LGNFCAFVDYVESEKPNLTKAKRWISRNHLCAMNERMSEPERKANSQSDQDSYPMLHLFYHLSIAADLVRMKAAASGKAVLNVTERLTLFRKLNKAEQYFFLLETFWLDTDWENLQYKESNPPDYGVHLLFEKLLEYPPEETIFMKDASRVLMFGSFLSYRGYFMYYFRYFGIWTFTVDDEKSNRYILAVNTIRLTRLGHFLGREFTESRRLEDWNEALLMESGEWPAEIEEPFLEAFRHLFPQGALKNSLPRQTGMLHGCYDIKISLQPSTWRVIRVPSEYTLHDLHLAIQEAFNFGGDHLYAFFMDGKKWSRRSAFYSPDDGDTPCADEASLGELRLWEGRSFLYLYDYGTEWCFRVAVERVIECDDKPDKPQLLASQGASPEEYPEEW